MIEDQGHFRCCFFFNDTATTEIYTLSLHDALPISIGGLTGVRQAEAGVASGLLNTSQQIGGAIGVALATTIATAFTNHYVNSHPGVNALSGSALTHGFQITFYVLAAIAVAGAVLAGLLTQSRSATTPPQQVEPKDVPEAA